GRVVEVVGAGEGGVGAQAKLLRAAAKAAAEYVEEEALAVAEKVAGAAHAAALPHPGGRGLLLDHLEHGVAELREQLHVLMPVDEIGQLSEQLLEHGKLALGFLPQQVGLEAAQEGAHERFLDRQERAVTQRLEARNHRTMRRRQREMQADRHAPLAGIEDA